MRIRQKPSPGAFKVYALDTADLLFLKTGRRFSMLARAPSTSQKKWINTVLLDMAYFHQVTSFIFWSG